MTAIAGVADAYSLTGAAWARGPARIYDRLAEMLVGLSPVPLAGRRVLDLGAGTGAASRAIAAAGGTAVALDSAIGMLLVDAGQRPPAVVGDALRLPFASGALHGVVAAFSLNHVTDPAAALREARRIVQPGSPILASAYALDDSHPAREATEQAAREQGWSPPSWYAELKSRAVPLLATADGAARAAQAAGLRATVHAMHVDFPELAADDLVEWRLGMVSLAPFVSSLDAAARERLRERALDLLGAAPTLRRSSIAIAATRPDEPR